MRRIAMLTSAFFLLQIILAAGCVQQLSPEARGTLFAGKAAYEREDFPEAVEHMDTFVARYHKASEVGVAYYYRGLARQALGELAAAQKDIAIAADTAKDKNLRTRALIALGDIAYAGGDLSAAEKFYRKALADIDRSKAPADHAMFYLGCTYQRMGEWIQADRQFNALVALFDGEKLAILATPRLHARAWTIQAGAFSSKAPAEAEAKRLGAEGLDARAWDGLRPSGPMVLVQVGRYENYAQARKALKSVSRFSAGAFVNTTR